MVGNRLVLAAGQDLTMQLVGEFRPARRSGFGGDLPLLSLGAKVFSTGDIETDKDRMMRPRGLHWTTLFRRSALLKVCRGGGPPRVPLHC